MCLQIHIYIDLACKYTYMMCVFTRDLLPKEDLNKEDFLRSQLKKQKLECRK